MSKLILAAKDVYQQHRKACLTVLVVFVPFGTLIAGGILLAKPVADRLANFRFNKLLSQGLIGSSEIFTPEYRS